MTHADHHAAREHPITRVPAHCARPATEVAARYGELVRAVAADPTDSRAGGALTALRWCLGLQPEGPVGPITRTTRPITFDAIRAEYSAAYEAATSPDTRAASLQAWAHGVAQGLVFWQLRDDQITPAPQEPEGSALTNRSAAEVETAFDQVEREFLAATRDPYRLGRHLAARWTMRVHVDGQPQPSPIRQQRQQLDPGLPGLTAIVAELDAAAAVVRYGPAAGGMPEGGDLTTEDRRRLAEGVGDWLAWWLVGSGAAIAAAAGHRRAG